MDNKIVKNAALSAVLTALYIVIIGSFLFYAPGTLGQRADTVLVPIVMLSLLVFSAALTGLLIFGRPVMWYLDGKKKEAVLLLVCTLVIFLILTIIALFALALV